MQGLGLVNFAGGNPFSLVGDLEPGSAAVGSSGGRRDSAPGGFFGLTASEPALSEARDDGARAARRQLTRIVASALMPATVALIVAVPAAIPEAMPPPSTVATLSSEERKTAADPS